MSRMVTQDVKISIVPGGVPPRISIKQWGQGLNTLRFHVYDTDGSPYIIPSDTSVSFKGRVQVSGGTNAILMYRCTTTNNLVTVVVPIQLTIETGDIYCELCFTDSNGNSTASIDIILEILPGTPTTGTVISGSDLAYANQVLNDLQSSYAQQVLQNTSPFKFKGTVEAQSNLPSSGNTVNDTYYVTDLGYTMTWNGSAWSRSSFGEDKYAERLVSAETRLTAEEAKSEELTNGKISKPIYKPDGQVGQVLRSNGNGETEWVTYGIPTDEQAKEALTEWLDEHPEALKEMNYDASTATLIM